MSPGDSILEKGREGHLQTMDGFLGNDACNRSADVKCVDGSPAWLLSNKLTAQVTSFLPAISQTHRHRVYTRRPQFLFAGCSWLRIEASANISAVACCMTA